MFRTKLYRNVALPLTLTDLIFAYGDYVNSTPLYHMKISFEFDV
jgi:hypothetical protein